MKIRNVVIAMLLVVALSSITGCVDDRRHDSESEYDRAAAVYEALHRSNLKRSKAYNESGSALLAKGDLDGAIAAYIKATELDSELPLAKSNMDTAFNESGGTITIIGGPTTPELDQDRSKAYDNLGIALLAKGDLDGAIVAHKNAVKLDPRSVSAHHNLGGVLRTKGDFDGAVAAYERTLELDPEFFRVYTNLVATHYFRKDYDKAWHAVWIARSQGLDEVIDPKLMKDLEKDSGRRK